MLPELPESGAAVFQPAYLRLSVLRPPFTRPDNIGTDKIRRTPSTLPQPDSTVASSAGRRSAAIFQAALREPSRS